MGTIKKYPITILNICIIIFGPWLLDGIIPYPREWILFLGTGFHLFLFVRAVKQITGFRNWSSFLTFSWNSFQLGTLSGVQLAELYMKYIDKRRVYPTFLGYQLLATTYINVEPSKRFLFQEKALFCLKTAHDLFDVEQQTQEFRPSLLIAMGDIYLNSQNGDRRTNLLEAKHYFLQASEYYDAKGMELDQEWLKLQARLGHVHLSMPFKQENDLRKAANYYETVLLYADDDFENTSYPSWFEQIISKYLFKEIDTWRIVDIYLSLATVYLNISNSLDNLNNANDLLNRALELCSPSLNKLHYIKANTMLGDMHRKCFEITNDISENSSAVECYKKGLIYSTPEEDSYQYALLQTKLGSCWRDVNSLDVKEQLHRSILCFEEAAKYFSIEFTPVEMRQVRKDLGDIYLIQKNWQFAWNNYEQAIKISKYIFEASMFSESKIEESSASLELYHNASFTLSMMGRSIEGMLILEMGRASLLSEQLSFNLNRPSNITESVWNQFSIAAINFRKIWVSNWKMYSSSSTASDDLISLTELYKSARNDLDSAISVVRQQTSSFMQDITYADIVGLAFEKGTHIVAFCITKVGSIVYIVYPDNNVDYLRSVRFPKFTTDLLNLLFGFYNQQSEIESMRIQTESLLNKLGEEFYIPISKCFSRFYKKILIIPTLQLHHFPMHACSYKQGDKLHYLLDDYEFSYAPSLKTVYLLQNQVNLRESIDPLLLAIIDPTNDLPYSDLERDSVTEFFGKDQSFVLQGESATWSNIKEYASECTYVHFACHGAYDYDNVLNSKLILAGGAPLTLKTLFIENVFAKARIVVLSACETGITDTKGAVDEYIGLPAGFLYSGIPYVICTLWPVDDCATSILMERFYYYHIVEGFEPSQSLRKSQVWLRDSTRGTLGDYYSSFIRMDPSFAMDRAIQMLTDGDISECPYVQPYYWAAFAIVGL